MIKRLHQKHSKMQHQKSHYLKDLSLRNFILLHEQKILFSFNNVIIPSILTDLKENPVKNIHKFNPVNIRYDQ